MFGQLSEDTLFIANKKYPLTRTKTFLNGRSGTVDLPSEYKEIKSDLTFLYNKDNDSTYMISYDNEGNQYTVIASGPDSCSLRRKDKLIYHLYSFIDTIKIKVKEFGPQRPFIKSKNKKIYFCSSKIDVIKNDTISCVKHDPIPDGRVFSFWDDGYQAKEADYNFRKQAKYILKDLYYRKGDATYFFDRTFVIVLY